MSTLAHPTVADLRPVDLFDELSDAELEPWAQAATVREAANGERILEAGEDRAAVVMLLEGRLEMLIPEGEVEARQGTQEAPTWIGATYALLRAPSAISLRTLTPVRCAVLEADAFIELTLAHRSVFTRAMAQMKPVMSRAAQRYQQRERL